MRSSCTNTPIDQPSKTLWWIVNRKTRSCGASRSNSMRNRGPCARSKGCPACSVASRSTSASCLRPGNLLQIADLQPSIDAWFDHLHESVIADCKAGTQHFVALSDRLEALLKSRLIKLASQVNGRGDVIDGTAGHHPIQKPQALLGKRGRNYIHLLF